MDLEKIVETISIITADSPIAELDDIIREQNTQLFAQVIDRVIKTRGLKVSRIERPSSNEPKINYPSKEILRENTDPNTD